MKILKNSVAAFVALLAVAMTIVTQASTVKNVLLEDGCYVSISNPGAQLPPANNPGVLIRDVEPPVDLSGTASGTPISGPLESDIEEVCPIDYEIFCCYQVVDNQVVGVAYRETTP